MPNHTKISQWGNSLAIRLPQALVSELAIERGVEVELHIENGGFRVTICWTKESSTYAKNK